MGKLFGGGNETSNIGKDAEANKGAAQTDSYGLDYGNFRGNNFAQTPGIAALQQQSQQGPQDLNQGILDSTLLSAFLGNRTKPDRNDLSQYAMQQGMNMMNGGIADFSQMPRGQVVGPGVATEQDAAKMQGTNSPQDLQDLFAAIFKKYQ